MSKKKDIIVTVRVNTSTGQKLITVPKKCHIEEGDVVALVKIEWKRNKENMEETE